MATKLSPRKVRFSPDTHKSFLDKDNSGNNNNDDDDDETYLNNEMFEDAITTNYDEYSKVEEEGSDVFDTFASQEQEKKEKVEKVLHNSKSTLLNNQRGRFPLTASLHSNGNENKKRTSNKTRESGIQRLQYELSNLKSRLFDSLQEYEDFKDSYPDKNFPVEWEPPPVKDLRSKVARLSMRIEREKNKLKMKANDKEVRRIVESILDRCDDDDDDAYSEDKTKDEFSSLERFTVSELTTNNGVSNEPNKQSGTRKGIKASGNSVEGTFCRIPEELKTRQRRLFIAGAVPPRTPSEREASEAALHCALSRLPPISTRRIKPSRKFGKISAEEAEKEKRKIVMVPNKRRLENGRAFVHERQKEFISFHKKRFYDMNVTFTRTAFEDLK